MDKFNFQEMTKLMKQVEETTKCPVCLGMLRIPLRYCVNGHSTCRQCGVGLAVCPTCRGGFTNLKSVTLESVLRILPRECKFSGLGCRRILLSHTLEEHESVCSMRKIRCRFPSCPWQDQANQLSQHQKEKHISPKRTNDVYECQWNQKQPLETKESLTAFEEFGNVIYLYLKVDTVKEKLITFTVCVPINDEKYQDLYSVITFKNIITKIGFQYSQKVFKENIEPRDISSNEKCMTIPLSELSHFIDDNYNLRFSLDIIKIQ